MVSIDNVMQRWKEIGPKIHALPTVPDFDVDIMLGPEEEYLVVIFYEKQFLSLPMEQRTKASELVAAIRNIIADDGLPVTILMSDGMP